MANTTNTRTIPLTQGYEAIVDADDYDMIMQWKWSAQRVQGGVRAVRSGPRGKHIEKREVFKMHRVIMSAPTGTIVDHINHDMLDNRKSNLRICTAKENSRNRRSAIGSKSRYIGVNWSNRYRKWEARLKIGGRSLWFGRYTEECDAARAYDAAAVIHYGEFANLNFTLATPTPTPPAWPRTMQ